MVPLLLIISFCLTIFTTVTLAYVSMVSMLGPWLAPTIALIGNFITRRLYLKRSDHATEYQVAALQAIAAGGGTIAVGVGFALPMLYFLDAALFTQLLAQPLYFFLAMGLITLCAGSLGIFLGWIFANPLIDQHKLPFPSSRLTFNVIHSAGNSEQTKTLALGFALTSIICTMRDGIWRFAGFIPKSISIASIFGCELAFSLSPMLAAVGFSAGVRIVLPLLVGFLSKPILTLLIPPIIQFFWTTSAVTPSAILMGFCSGLILSELISGIYSTGIFAKIYTLVKSLFSSSIKSWKYDLFLKNLIWGCHPREGGDPSKSFIAFMQQNKSTGLYGAAIGLCSLALLITAGFSLFAGLSFLILSGIATYHICVISGHIGMVQFGRFSTFIMIPMLLFFTLLPQHLTLICIFFHICAASASDYLFDYNIFHIGRYPKKHLVAYQLIGLVVTALSIGVIFWLLFTNFQLGSPDLFGQRGRTKALLIQTLSFDYFTLVFGFFYGFLLKKFRISPAMTLGGLLMPASLLWSLVGGGLISALPVNKERYAPFCAGVLTSESMWVIVTIVSKIF
ncbi:OPT/YSL family transporter [Candidatus Dependentiae bacterium]|nr:OPT/YSL family transporter [Candidatus Dependentiae bacterium]